MFPAFRNIFYLIFDQTRIRENFTYTCCKNRPTRRTRKVDAVVLATVTITEDFMMLLDIPKTGIMVAKNNFTLELAVTPQVKVNRIG